VLGLFVKTDGGLDEDDRRANECDDNAKLECGKLVLVSAGRAAAALERRTTWLETGSLTTISSTGCWFDVGVGGGDSDVPTASWLESGVHILSVVRSAFIRAKKSIISSSKALIVGKRLLKFSF
jgi:hypothetical protein